MHAPINTHTHTHYRDVCMGWKTAASLCLMGKSMVSCRFSLKPIHWFWGLLERAQASEESENVKVARFTLKTLDCTQHRSTCFVERNGLCSRNLGLELGTQSYPFRSVLGWRASEVCVLVYSGTATCKWVYEEKQWDTWMNYRVAFRHAKLLLAANGRDHNATSQFLGIYISSTWTITHAKHSRWHGFSWPVLPYHNFYVVITCIFCIILPPTSHPLSAGNQPPWHCHAEGQACGAPWLANTVANYAIIMP